MKSIVLQSKECAKPLNDFARHQMIVRLYQDILLDMAICEIEGWDKLEYLRELKELIDGFAK